HCFQSSLTEPPLYPFRLNQFEILVEGPPRPAREAKAPLAALASVEPAQHCRCSMASPLQFAAQGEKSNWTAPSIPPGGERVPYLLCHGASLLQVAAQGEKSNWTAPSIPPAGERVLELALPGASRLQFAAQGEKSNWTAPSIPPEGERGRELALPASAAQV